MIDVGRALVSLEKAVAQLEKDVNNLWNTFLIVTIILTVSVAVILTFVLIALKGAP